MLVPHLREGLPNLPMFLVGLTSVSALTYVGKKVADSRKPSITAVVPSLVSHGKRVRVQGAYLATGPGGVVPAVTIGGVPAPDVTVLEPTVPSLGEESVLSVFIPPDAPLGDQTLEVAPPGAATATHTVTVEGVTITTIDPALIKAKKGTPFVITGRGFRFNGAAPDVHIGSHMAVVQSWSDTRIQVNVPDPTPVGVQTVAVTVDRDSDDCTVTLN